MPDLEFWESAIAQPRPGLLTAPMPRRVREAAVAVDCARDLLRQAEAVLAGLDPRHQPTVFTARDWLRTTSLGAEQTYRLLCAVDVRASHTEEGV